MLEIMLGLGAKKPATYWPDSGPGTKMLQFGDESAGFFGEVSTTELYDALGIVALSKIVGGTVYSGDFSWLKFFINGKVVYYAKQQVLANVSHNDVYSAGCALGIRGIGPFPIGAGVDQHRIGIVKEAERNWPLLLRLPKTGSTDPALIDSVNVLESEWNRTIMRTANGGWGTYTTTQLSRGSGDVTSVCVETWTNSTTYVYTRGSNGNVDGRSNVVKTQNSYWRPVLELLDASSIAFDPQYFEYDGLGLIPPSIVDTPPTLETMLKNVTDIYWTTPLQTPPSITEVTFIDMSFPAVDVAYGIPGLKDFGFVSEDVDTIASQRLIWSIGPLNDFGFTAETI